MKTAAKRLTAVDIRRGKRYTSPMYRLLIKLVLAMMLAWPLRSTSGTAPQTGLFFHGLHEPGNRLPDRTDPGALALVVET